MTSDTTLSAGIHVVSEGSLTTGESHANGTTLMDD